VNRMQGLASPNHSNMDCQGIDHGGLMKNIELSTSALLKRF
jgi:hypothetical protein